MSQVTQLRVVCTHAYACRLLELTCLCLVPKRCWVSVTASWRRVHTHLLELHDVRVHQAPVVEDLTLHILGHLQQDNRVSGFLRTRAHTPERAASSSGPALVDSPTRDRGSCQVLHTFSPRSMNLQATSSPVVLSLHSCTKPNVPLLRSLTCACTHARQQQNTQHPDQAMLRDHVKHTLIHTTCVHSPAAAG